MIYASDRTGPPELFDPHDPGRPRVHADPPRAARGRDGSGPDRRGCSSARSGTTTSTSSPIPITTQLNEVDGRTRRIANGQGKEAPHLVEEVYNLEDALVVGGLIITLLRHCDRVRLACLAQLINDIAPLVTNADGVLRQTIYYPYAWALKYGRGTALNLVVESETYEVPEYWEGTLRRHSWNLRP